MKNSTLLNAYITANEMLEEIEEFLARTPPALLPEVAFLTKYRQKYKRQAKKFIGRLRDKLYD